MSGGHGKNSLARTTVYYRDRISGQSSRDGGDISEVIWRTPTESLLTPLRKGDV